jgi:hypothetical protein
MHKRTPYFPPLTHEVAIQLLLRLFFTVLFLSTMVRSWMLKVLPANANRGQYYAQIIRAGKLEARPFFFSNFKGTSSQQEQNHFQQLKG